MVRYYLLVMIGIFIHLCIQAQSLLSNAGDDFKTTNFNVSWSLGEIVTETFSTDTYKLTQGFQQGKLTPVGIIEPKNSFKEAIEVFPNPTQGVVCINLNKDILKSEELPDYYSLYDIQGKQLTQQRSAQYQFKLDLNSYSGAVYYLRLFNSESKYQSTVIIQKIN